jgi:hypothetical protein
MMSLRVHSQLLNGLESTTGFSKLNINENSCSSPSAYRYEDQALIPSPILCRTPSLRPEISGSPGSKARHNLNALEDRVRPKPVMKPTLQREGNFYKSRPMINTLLIAAIYYATSP